MLVSLIPAYVILFLKLHFVSRLCLISSFCQYFLYSFNIEEPKVTIREFKSQILMNEEDKLYAYILSIRESVEYVT
jgi:hypothetical protein